MTTTEELDEKIAEYHKIIETKEKEILALIEPMLVEVLQDPVASYSWTQYTTYFNDGDACNFRVRAYDDCLECYDENGEEVYWSEEVVSRKAIEAIQGFVTGVPENLMLSLFGDHAKITITSEGSTVEHYSNHD